jgi:hypothetical protein
VVKRDLRRVRELRVALRGTETEQVGGYSAADNRQNSTFKYRRKLRRSHRNEIRTQAEMATKVKTRYRVYCARRRQDTRAKTSRVNKVSNGVKRENKGKVRDELLRRGYRSDSGNESKYKSQNKQPGTNQNATRVSKDRKTSISILAETSESATRSTVALLRDRLYLILPLCLILRGACNPAELIPERGEIADPA